MFRILSNPAAVATGRGGANRKPGQTLTALRYAILVGAGLCWPVPQALADLMLHPTRVVLEKNSRAAQLDLINRGADTATYRISLVNRRMNEVGQFTEVDTPQPGELFSESMIRYSPRQVTLAPGAGQTIRILLRKPENLAPGEYRSHLLFQRVAEGQDQPAPENRDTTAKDLEIRLRALVSVSLPIIVRHGETSATAEFDKVAVTKNPSSGEPVLEFDLRRNGNRSLYGDIIVTFTPTGGAAVGVGRANGVAVYSPNPFRHASLPLGTPAGVQLGRGTLRVVYSERPEEGGKVLTERTLQLP